MRLRARLLNVLVLAPVVATVVAALGPAIHAQASSGAEPQPVVIALDPGHGGAPDPSNPTQPFDPGAISASGLMEKVVTLDVARRVASLLHEDMVQTVLTRDTDQWVTIADRETIAIDAHAERFISIHCNSFTDA
ncbi:MAG: N-acetylmuramoyl-L-alanine amidase family protein, partial [Candidatus Dormibacteria bacterium]